MLTTAEQFRAAFRGTFVSPALYRLPENPGGGLATSPGKSRPGGTRPQNNGVKRMALQRIGTFQKKKSEAQGAEGGDVFHVLKISLPFQTKGDFLVHKVENKEKDTAPDYRITHDGFEVGAIWDAVSKEGKPYKSGRIVCLAAPEGELEFMVFPEVVPDGAEKKGLHPVFFEPKKQKSVKREADQSAPSFD